MSKIIAKSKGAIVYDIYGTKHSFGKEIKEYPKNYYSDIIFYKGALYKNEIREETKIVLPFEVKNYFSDLCEAPHIVMSMSGKIYELEHPYSKISTEYLAENVVDVSSDYNEFLYLVDNGEVYHVYYNYEDSDDINREITKINIKNIKAIKGGRHCHIMLDHDGNVYYFIWNYGKPVVKKIVNIPPIKYIGGEEGHILISEHHTVFCYLSQDNKKFHVHIKKLKREQKNIVKCKFFCAGGYYDDYFDGIVSVNDRGDVYFNNASIKDGDAEGLIGTDIFMDVPSLLYMLVSYIKKNKVKWDNSLNRDLRKLLSYQPKLVSYKDIYCQAHQY